MMSLSTPTKRRLFKMPLVGRKVYPSEILGRPIRIDNYEIIDSPKNKDKKLVCMQLYTDKPCICMTESFTLIDTLKKADKSNLPFCSKIIKKKDNYYYFVKLNEFEKKLLQKM